MRIARIETSEGPRLAVQQDGRWIAAAPAGVTLPQMLSRDAAFTAVGPEIEGDILAPLVPGKIVAIGLNYMDHIREAEAEVPAAPLVFTKFPSSVTGPDSEIVIDTEMAQRVDWEVELALVIGRTARNVDESEAMDYVFGFTIANDVSARDMQFGDGQWVRGKSQDTFCPLGPVVVTADEIERPGELALSTRVNGELKQDSSTRELIFGLPQLVSYCSRNFTLEPGDMILTGTPWGCGEFMSPPEHLHPGDLVECRIEGIGALQNRVVAAS